MQSSQKHAAKLQQADVPLLKFSTKGIKEVLAAASIPHWPSVEVGFNCLERGELQSRLYISGTSFSASHKHTVSRPTFLVQSSAKYSNSSRAAQAGRTQDSPCSSTSFDAARKPSQAVIMTYNPYGTIHPFAAGLITVHGGRQRLHTSSALPKPLPRR